MKAPVAARNCSWWAAALLLCGGAAGHADFDGFLQLGDLKGGATEANHKDWMVVQAFSQGVLNRNSSAGAGGAGTGRASFADLTFRKELDKASPQLELACARGAHFKTAVLECVKTTDQRSRFYRVDLGDVVVRKVESWASGDLAKPLEEIGLTFGKITWTYTEFDAKGAKKGDVSTSWSLALNKGAALMKAAARAEEAQEVEVLAGPAGASADALATGSTAVFQVTAAQQGADQMALSWPAHKGSTYVILASPQLDGGYEPVRRLTAEQDGLVTVTLEMSGGARFFLVEEEVE